MNNLRYFYLPMAAMLAACAANPTTPEELAQAIPPEQRAYIIGSYATGCEPKGDSCVQRFNSLSVYYRDSNDRKKTGRLNSTKGSVFSRNDTVYDYVSPESHENGQYFCQAVAAGSYEFYTFDFYNFAGGGNGYFLREENQFSLPFNVQPGEVVYLGKLKLATGSGRNLLGMSIASPGQLLLSSDRRRDVVSALQKCPESVKHQFVREAPLKAAAANHPLVQDEPFLQQ